MTYEELWHRLIPLYDAGEAKAIIRLVMEERFGLSFTDILCGKVTELSANDQTELEKIILRLEKGEPVQYVLGVADFCGHRFHVAPEVLIPRPETAQGVRRLMQFLASDANILDIGTGSGCIAITLALEIPEAKVTAWDISDDALRIAHENACTLSATVTFEHRDILSSSADDNRTWDVIVSNPPYIQPSERDGMEENVLSYEPHIALFAPEDQPILFYQRIAGYAWQSLNAKGILFFELNPLTAQEVFNHVQQLGFSDVEILNDQYGKQRFLKAIKI